MGEIIPIRTARRERMTGEAHRLARGVARGEFIRIRQGAYVERELAEASTPAALHRARIVATRLAAVSEPTFSHESAAALHGIPLLGGWPTKATTTVSARATSSGAVRRSVRSLPDEDRVVLDDGCHATSPARTAIDIAASRSLLAGIVAISHVRAHGVSTQELAAAITRAGRFPGVRRARLALSRSTEASRSVLETLILVRCQDYGFAVPAQQAEVLGVDGIGYRVDFAWDGGRIVAIGDARDKEPVPDHLAGLTPVDALWAEQRRQDALSPGRAFVRIDWAEAWGGQGLARRLIAAGVPRPDVRLVGLTF